MFQPETLIFEVCVLTLIRDRAVWTAQGAYFTANAEQLARATGTTGPQMTAKLSGILLGQTQASAM